MTLELVGESPHASSDSELRSLSVASISLSAASSFYCTRIGELDSNEIFAVIPLTTKMKIAKYSRNTTLNHETAKFFDRENFSVLP